MNGNGNKLYRSMSEAKLGGVAAGLGNYFKVDPTIFRIIFVPGTIFSGGALALAYLALWLVMPTATTKSTDLGGIVRENLDELGSKLRGTTSGSTPNGGNGSPKPEVSSTQSGGPNTTPVGDYQKPEQPSTPQAGAGQCSGMNWMPFLLIFLGMMFLFSSFRYMHGISAGWHRGWFPWPVLLIVIGFLVLKGRRYR